jgi:hypothetical protein
MANRLRQELNQSSIGFEDHAVPAEFPQSAAVRDIVALGKHLSPKQP